MSLVASLYAGGKSVWGGLSSVVTSEKLIEHNLAKDAHPLIRDDAKTTEDIAKLAIKRVEELRTDQVMTMARLARLVAADREQNPRKKANSADAVEVAFRRYVRQGVSLEEAFLAALNEAH